MDTISKDSNEKLNTLLARAIYASSTPLSIVENHYFKNFMQQARPAFKLPSRYQLSVSLLEKEFKLVQGKVKRKIADAETMSILTDGWTDINGVSLINIIFCTPSPVFYRIIDSGTETHTGEYISKVLAECIEEVGSDKVDALISDNARNMKSAWQHLKEKYPHLITFGCLAHGLNLLIKDLFKIPSFARCSTISKDIIKIFRNKQLPKQILQKIQLSEVGKEVSLTTSVETRWGSVILSLKSLLKNRDFLQKAVLDKRLKEKVDARIRKSILDDDGFWTAVKNICDLTQPILNSITELESDKLTMAKIYPSIKRIEFVLKEKIGFLNVTERKKVEEMFINRKEFFSHDVQIAAYMLDPKEKADNLGLSEDENSLAINFIVAYASQKNFNVDMILTNLAEFKAKTGAWANRNVWRSAKGTDSLTWWKAFFSQQELCKVAVRLLGLPATAASCERNFKAYSLIKTKKRNRLTVERANKLVYVKYNLKLLEGQFDVDDDWEENNERETTEAMSEEENEEDNTSSASEDFSLHDTDSDDMCSEDGENETYELQEINDETETEVHTEYVQCEPESPCFDSDNLPSEENIYDMSMDNDLMDVSTSTVENVDTASPQDSVTSTLPKPLVFTAQNIILLKNFVAKKVE